MDFVYFIFLKLIPFIHSLRFISLYLSLHSVLIFGCPPVLSMKLSVFGLSRNITYILVANKKIVAIHDFLDGPPPFGFSIKKI